MSSPDTAPVPVPHHPATASLKTLLFEELPSWMQVDPHIKRGYRKELSNVTSCIASLFYIHNEFANAWSHLAPAIIHVVCLVREVWDVLDIGENVADAAGSWEEKQQRRNDVLMVQVYVLSTVLCLLSSSAYHIFNAHSQPVATRLLKLDYLGIVLNTAATCITSTWFGLRAQPDLRQVYMSSSIAIGIAIFTVLLLPGMDGVKAAVWRSTLFAAFVASGYIPMAHNYILFGPLGLHSFPFTAAIVMASFYAASVVFYVTGFPERFVGGVFDIWGSSHQIFHVLVMLGQIAYIRGLKQLLL